MKFYQKLDGGVHVSAREYDIAADTAIKEGQVVKLSSGFVVAAAVGETSAILGFAAENHSGVADALDPRANGTKILIIDDPMTVMQCKAPEITAASGTATTIVAAEGQLAAFGANDLTGGYVQLLSKAANSTNTDAIGQTRRITSFASASSTLTVESGGTAAEDDVYAIYPPVGFAKGNLNADRTALVLTATANIALKVIGSDRKLGKIMLAAGKHVFAVNS